MRLIVHGQQAFGKAVLEAMLERGDNVVGVYCAPDKEGRPEDPLKTLKPYYKESAWREVVLLTVGHLYENGSVRTGADIIKALVHHSGSDDSRMLVCSTTSRLSRRWRTRSHEQRSLARFRG